MGGEFNLYPLEFLKFGALVDDATRHVMEMRPSNLSEFEAFLAQIPAYYQPYLLSYFSFKKFTFLTSKKLNFFQKLLSSNSQFPSEMMNKLVWKILRDKAHYYRESETALLKNKIIHDRDEADCCLPPYLKKGIDANSQQAVNMYSRERLLSGVTRMRDHLLGKGASEKFIDLVKVPEYNKKLISRMSDYSETMRKMQELRIPVYEDHEIRNIKEPIPFGNPFKYMVRTKITKVAMGENVADEAFLTSMDTSTRSQKKSEGMADGGSGGRVKKKYNPQEAASNEDKFKNLLKKRKQLDELSGVSPRKKVQLERKESNEFPTAN
eukprot:TRINITY_DN22039_c0_g1_i2.p1 TRINITY_DN22039_c0_g1~~TRINITY_DN22039_c0_g1_i2.p1  ORF type:complete len:323 (-),score=60.01 TRINITY_DN22039_c0_g1_i2:24-992(-)